MVSLSSALDQGQRNLRWLAVEVVQREIDDSLLADHGAPQGLYR